jgi:hypothetical protein
LKPYGVEVEECPDVADIKAMGSKSSVGKLPGKSGDYHPYCQGWSKSRIRRYWARRARAQGKAETSEQNF